MQGWRRRGALTAGVLCAAAVLAAPARSQSSLIEEGRELAAARCGICHAVAPGTESPHRSSPPFATFHEGFPIAMLDQAKGSGVISGHDEMPMFELTPRETAALLTYIDSLSPIRRRYMTPGR